METYHFILEACQNNALSFLVGFAICLQLIITIISKLRNKNQIDLNGCKCDFLKPKYVTINKELINSLLFVDKRVVPELKSGEKMICTIAKKKIMVARIDVSSINLFKKNYEYLYWEII